MLRRLMQSVVAVGFGTLFFVVSCFSGPSKSGAQAVVTLRTEFGPGADVTKFIGRAQALGATEVTLYEQRGGAAVIVSQLELARATREQRAAFDQAVAAQKEGVVQALVPGMPPFERFLCDVTFKDGKVVSSETRVVD